MDIGEIYKVTTKGIEEDPDLFTNACCVETTVKIVSKDLRNNFNRYWAQDEETGHGFFVFPQDVENGWLEKL